MSEAVAVIRREIAKRETEIAALQMALDALTGSAAMGRKSGKQLALPAPAKPGRKRAPKPDDEGNFTVNGTDLHLTPRELAVIEAISAADDCLPAEQLDPLCNGKRNSLTQCIFYLNKKLKAAGAEIKHFKGEGYRLQNIEEGE